MKRCLLWLCLSLVILPVASSRIQEVQAQTDLNQNMNFAGEIKTDMAIPPTPDQFFTAKVLNIMAEGERDVVGYTEKYQTVELEILSEPEKGKHIELEYGSINLTEDQKVEKGETVLVIKNEGLKGNPYSLADKYRVPAMAYILVFFFALVVVFAGWKGLGSMAGLASSILILGFFIIPGITSTDNPFWIILGGSILISLISLYLGHGFNKRTTLALVSTMLTLCAAIGLSFLFVSWARLYGMGSEESFFLQFGPLENINLKGLLLGGIIIGTLGILDDITTAQTAAVEEIKKANDQLSFHDLYQRGLSVGKEHIASLVNTLVLAYAGASLPLFLLFSINSSQPVWVTLNSQFMAEEIIRTLVGSCALVLAVPISTILAAWVFGKRKV